MAEPAAARPIDDPSRLRVVVGRIVKAWPHPDSEKLWCEQIDIGEPEPRQIASGIRHYYPNESDLVGRLVVVLANLKPRKLAGFESQGMILCAVLEAPGAPESHGDAPGTRLEFIEPPADAAVGDRVVVGGVEGEFDATLHPKKNPWEHIAPHLRTQNGDAERPVACYKDIPMTTSAGVLTCKSLVGAKIQ